MLIRFTASASVFDASDEPVTSVDVLRKLDGAASNEVFTDYFGGTADEANVALLLENGGYLQFRFDESRGRLQAVTEFRAARALDDAELELLSNYTCGQWSDGIGENFAGESFDRFGCSLQPDFEEVEAVQVDDGVASAGNPAADVFRAIDAGDPAAVAAAIPKCSNIDARLSGFSPLRWAIFREQADIAVQLAQHCDLTLRDMMGSSPLHALVWSGLSDEDSTRVARALIEAGADVNAIDDRGETAAADAEFRDKKQLCALLKASGSAK